MVWPGANTLLHISFSSSLVDILSGWPRPRNKTLGQASVDASLTGHRAGHEWVWQGNGDNLAALIALSGCAEEVSRQMQSVLRLKMLFMTSRDACTLLVLFAFLFALVWGVGSHVAQAGLKFSI